MFGEALLLTKRDQLKTPDRDQYNGEVRRPKITPFFSKPKLKFIAEN